VRLRYLLDTNVVSSTVAKAPNRAVLKLIQRHGHECAIAAPVWHELTYGCQRLASARRRETLQAFLLEVVLASFPILTYDEAAARWHGIERARLERLGKPAPYVDGQIAAIARVNELTLVTGNVRDFVRFKGLAVADWSKRTR
jgi:tRNA(fMet)-specific endonuclease VapC